MPFVGRGSARDAAAVELAILAALSLAIYVLGFARPYALGRWWALPAQTIAIISDGNPDAALDYAVAVGALFLLYGLAVYAARGRSGTAAWVVAIVGTVALNAALLGMYPVGSTDIFDDIIRGRMLALHGGNPLLQVPMDFPRDPFLYYASWRYVPSAYGPLWELSAGALARLAGDGVVANVLAFKLLSVASCLGVAALVGLALRRHAPDRALSGVLLFAWNPLVLYYAAGDGHNDPLMVFLAVLGIFWLDRGRFTLAALAETAGALAKFIPALLFPIVMVVALRRLRGWRARVIYLVATGLACAALVAVAYAPFWQPGATVSHMLGLDRRTKLFTTSLPTLLSVAVTPRLGQEGAFALASRAAVLVLVVWVVWQLWRLSRRDTAWHPPVEAGASTLLFYLLVSCLWFQPWYVTWPLALVALLPDGTLRRGALIYSVAAMAKMLLFNFLIPDAHGGILPAMAVREPPLTLGTLALPWAYFAWAGARALWARLHRRSAMVEAALESEEEEREDEQLAA